MDGDGCATRTMCARGNTRLQKLHDHGHEVFRRRWTPRAPRHGVRREVIEGHVDAKWVLIACLFAKLPVQALKIDRSDPVTLGMRDTVPNRRRPNARVCFGRRTSLPLPRREGDDALGD